MPLIPILGSFVLSWGAGFLGEKAAANADEKKKRLWGWAALAVIVILLALLAYFVWFK